MVLVTEKIKEVEIDLPLVLLSGDNAFSLQLSYIFLHILYPLPSPRKQLLHLDLVLWI